MSQELSSGTWSAPHEYIVGEREFVFMAELEATDARIGREVSEVYGRGVIPRRSLLFRVLRRGFFELKKVFGPLVRKILRFARRQWHRRIADRSRVADGAAFGSGGVSVEVHSLTSADLREKLADTQAAFWLLTREPGQLLQSATPQILSTLAASQAMMWFGDSRNSRGVRERRTVFSRILLRQVDALGPVVVVRTDVLWNLMAEREMSPLLWPLALGLSLDSERIELIPEVLGVGDLVTSWLGSAETDAADLVRNELARSELVATVEVQPLGRRRISYAISGNPLVSIIIPTRGSAQGGEAFVTEAVRSITQQSSYQNFEIVIVADGPTPQTVIDEIHQIEPNRIKWVRWSAPFNFSGKMNLGAACAAGEYLLFLNDDVEVVSPDWIERMLSLIGVDGIGYVGALLFFDDQTIQHAGHFYAKGAGHIGIGVPLRLTHPGQLFNVDRMVSGLTAACALVSSKIFAQVGGFSTLFPGNYNDVDLCMKLNTMGIKMAVAADSRLYHFESKSRDAKVLRTELLNLDARWHTALRVDRHWRGAEV